MRSRILNLSRTSIRHRGGGGGGRHNTNYQTSRGGQQPSHQQRYYAHTNMANTARSSIGVQCSSMLMNNMIVEGCLTRGWDVGVAVDDDDGG